ncbi:ATP-binding cassette domain-containing protein [Pusillimonas sp. CC-YST705]|uniref:ATP-binding protein Uup n=1 Tax=Mesopusillimonas faecipullorum TaxID=2755040 RepID=A0ABS8C9A7_9BURK|nr:ATP-binding cassette domain-containing protein [Mesopusillimonas faecipullorum]MCB5362617.1 ATP-binding cassette domain-containing protein [Mesopusillimonas faecipullorum]
MSSILISLSHVHLAYGHNPLLDDADLSIRTGERIGLIGRNGTGKSSLLKILDGRVQPDDGEVMRLGGLRVSTVEQEPEMDGDQTIFDWLCQGAEQAEDWARPARVQALLDELGLDGQSKIAGLSGGTRKRVALAQALADEPDLLLLDEPTNHLDLDAIQWLERKLQTIRCSLLLITHDRQFLDSVTTRIVELDRGQLHSFPGNFSAWQQRKAEWLAAEQQQNDRFDKLLAQEEVWIRKGIEARRTRNEGRVRRLEQLRRERQARLDTQGNVNLALSEGQRSGKLVAELKGVSHAFSDRVIVRELDFLLQRGDRIGLIGPNGVGKTTLIRILLGQLKPDAGEVRLGTNLAVAYFDQMRAQLDDEATVADTISPGSEWVEIGGQRKHIMRYLEDFLFPPARAHSPVRSLSGGERARLQLARLFARPANVLVLDEPTNDLDIETLELLESLLQEYTGTVILVSHDRAFLDNVVTQTLAWESEGNWREYVGGYVDWLAQRPSAAPNSSLSPAQAAPEKAAPAQAKPTAPKQNRLAPWEAKELDELPARITAVEEEQAALSNRLADGSLYRDNPQEVERINMQLAELETRMQALFERWETLEAKRPGA